MAAFPRTAASLMNCGPSRLATTAAMAPSRAQGPPLSQRDWGKGDTRCTGRGADWPGAAPLRAEAVPPAGSRSHRTDPAGPLGSGAAATAKPPSGAPFRSAAGAQRPSEASPGTAEPPGALPPSPGPYLSSTVARCSAGPSAGPDRHASRPAKGHPTPPVTTGRPPESRPPRLPAGPNLPPQRSLSPPRRKLLSGILAQGPPGKRPGFRRPLLRHGRGGTRLAGGGGGAGPGEALLFGRRRRRRDHGVRAGAAGHRRGGETGTGWGRWGGAVGGPVRAVSGQRRRSVLEAVSAVARSASHSRGRREEAPPV